MSDRGLAQVVDIAAARAKRGAQIGRGQARRANPGLRPPHAVWTTDWEAVADLSKREIRDILRGVKRPPMRFKRIRRGDTVLAKKATPLTRAQRRLAWKVERRTTGVAWSDSRAARGELAPVVPLRSRTMAKRLSVQPLAAHEVAADPMGDAA